MCHHKLQKHGSVEGDPGLTQLEEKTIIITERQKHVRFLRLVTDVGEAGEIVCH